MPTVYYSVFMGGDDMLEASEKKSFKLVVKPVLSSSNMFVCASKMRIPLISSANHLSAISELKKIVGLNKLAISASETH
jgi:hypothetical protein